ncbi:DinB family protein [Paenibacillus sp. S-38]|uniref:DinB family protein n=1 Tax=Paenibacillus sp. S-38 TaxID=3416710 RepID=UPI003CE9F6D6
MSIAEAIEKIRTSLDRVSAELDPWFEKSPALLDYRPERGWNAAQILEHVSLTNHFLLILIRKGTRKALERAERDGLPKDPGALTVDLERLDLIASHRSFRWERPAHMEPAGEKSMDEVRVLLHEQFGDCSACLEQLKNGEGTLYTTMMSVGGLGKIDVYQYLYFLCLHAERHLGQLQRVEAEYLASAG